MNLFEGAEKETSVNCPGCEKMIFISTMASIAEYSIGQTIKKHTIY